MRTVYFEWPWPRGGVYRFRLENPTAEGTFEVVLPNGEKVLVEVEEGRFPVVDTVPVDEPIGMLWPAELIFGHTEASQVFTDDWEPLVEMINAAAAVNTLFEVLLPKAEFDRLSAGGFDELKTRLSPRAQSLLYLVEETPTGQKYALELYRTGRCPC